MQTFKECFNIILTGDKDTSRQAARQVRKVLYSSRGHDDYNVIKSAIENAPVEYEKITEEWRQENFVMAISVMYFLHDKESRPDFLFGWLFQLIQHQNGYIRHAAVRMFENELGPLTVYIRIPDFKSSDSDRLTPQQCDTVLRNLFTSLHGLSNMLWQPKYKRYKYIDSLPPSPYKSVQMVLATMEEYCGEGYFTHTGEGEKKESKVEIESQERVLQRQKEIEQEIVEMLKETESDFTLNHVRDAIFHEEDNDDMMKIVAMFDRGGDASELDNILELVTDAWNYFPHKILGGISPVEKLLKYPSDHK